MAASRAAADRKTSTHDDRDQSPAAAAPDPKPTHAMIVVFGSINIDLVARVARLPCAGETLAGSSFATVPGGKGANQALAARRAGAEVAMAGAVGGDVFATMALSGLIDANINLDWIRR